jgi:hypothetical protein
VLPKQSSAKKTWPLGIFGAAALLYSNEISRLTQP